MPTSARTRSLLTWLPATILLVVIGLVVLATFAVQGSWWAEEKPSASADQKASDGSSILTDAGFDYVNVEGIVRVRIGEGALPAEELGMGANAEKSAEFRGPVRAVVAGGEDVYVVDDVGGLTAVSRNGELASVTLMFDSPGTWSDSVEQVQALAPTFGWDEAQITSLDEQLAEFNQSGTADTFTAVVGPSQGGAQVTATLTFDPGSGTTPVALTFEPGSLIRPSTSPRGGICAPASMRADIRCLLGRVRGNTDARSGPPPEDEGPLVECFAATSAPCCP